MDINKTYEELDTEGKIFFKGFCAASPWCKFERISKPESRWDISYLYCQDVLAIGEIKIRNYESTAFEDWIIEEEKVIALKEILAKTKKNTDKEIQIHYINIFNDNNVAIWDITNLVQVYRPETHKANNCGDQHERIKQVTYLPITDTIKFTKNER